MQARFTYRAEADFRLISGPAGVSRFQFSKDGYAEMPRADYDVLIIGAGLSGIGVARYLKTECPGKRFAILEGRARMGGTWDLFRYPGIRSDSDMHTMGYAFKPWKHAKAISEGHLIRGYIEETARENGLDPLIRYDHQVRRAEYDSAAALWRLTCATPEGEVALTTRFLFLASGYYKYDEGYLPEIAGMEDFAGQMIHPQFWPEEYDPAGRRIAVIGSGATAVTLTPTLAETAAQVIQVQRSPTYVVNRPSKDRIGTVLKRMIPGRAGYSLARWRIILAGQMRRKRMAKDIRATKRMMVGAIGKELEGKVPEWEKHFTPGYWPGQQRICVVPDGDFFEALKGGRAEMVTGEIERILPEGIRMKDGRLLEVDTIVTATGLVLDYFGGMEVSVDGQRVEPGKQLIFKGFMYSNVPNLLYFRGYTNASWTLKVDLVAEYACRLLRYMDRKGFVQVTPKATSEDFAQINTSISFTSGYFLRVMHRLPKHGQSFPWIHKQDYMWDRKTLRRGDVADGTLSFSAEGEAVPFPPEQQAGAAAEIAAE